MPTGLVIHTKRRFFAPETSRDFLCALLLCLFTITACAPIVSNMSLTHAGIGREPPEFCSGDRKMLTDSNLKKEYIISPPAGFFTGRDVIGDPIWAESGEHLELKWEGFFPRYRLYYFAPGEQKGVAVGECHFSGGCNKAYYLFYDRNKNGKPDAFYLTEWESLDYGDKQTPGYLDRYRHIYTIADDRYCIVHDLLFYRCSPPVSRPPDTCETSCDPPYRTIEIDGRSVPLVYRTEEIKYGAIFSKECSAHRQK